MDTIDEGKIKAITYQWVADWVDGKQLCPWAKKMLVENKLKLVVDPSPCYTLAGIWKVRQRLFQESKELLSHLSKVLSQSRRACQDTIKQPTYETTLLILPAVRDFERFLYLVHILERQLQQTQHLATGIQLPSFHPNYQFRHTNHDDVENYTNRSPFPMIHILPNQLISQATEGQPNIQTDRIWQRNVELMKSLGMEKVEAMQQEIVMKGWNRCLAFS
jgi:hypothetical protein